MLDKNNLLALMKQVAKAEPSAPVSYSFGGESFSYDQLNETLRKELNEYAATPALYRENKNLIFSLVEQTIDEILPKKVEQTYMQFAEIKQFKQGETPVFRRKRDVRSRAKQFVTRVGLAGVYEVCKLGPQESESFRVPASAIGGGCEVSLEEFLDGRVDFAEVTSIVMQGMDELIMKEVGHALKAAVNQLPPANIVVADDFDEEEFDRLLVIASAYGDPSIYCTYEFAVKMVPTEGWRYTESMKNELWNNGHLATYKGHRVIILPQGLEDESNTRKVIDPGYCYIIPSGADSKPVKIAFEGQAQAEERRGADWSRQFMIYKKVGISALLGNNICAYVDLALAGQYNLQGSHWDSTSYIDMTYPNA